MHKTIIIFIMKVKISPYKFVLPGEDLTLSTKIVYPRTAGERIYQKILISLALQGGHDSVIPGQFILFRFLKNRRGIRDI